jgi:hypothetical protein
VSPPSLEIDTLPLPAGGNGGASSSSGQPGPAPSEAAIAEVRRRYPDADPAALVAAWRADVATRGGPGQHVDASLLAWVRLQTGR